MNRTLKWLTEPIDEHDVLAISQAQTLIKASLLGVIVALGFFIERLISEPLLGLSHLSVLFALLAALLTPLLIRTTGRTDWALGFLLTVALFCLAADAWVYGGLGAPTFIAMMMMPYMANLAGGSRAAGLTTVGVVVVVIAYYLAAVTGIDLPEPTPAGEMLEKHAVALILCAVFLFLLTRIVEQERADIGNRLIDSQRRYTLTFAAGSDGQFEYRPASGTIWLSPMLLTYIGLRPDTQPSAFLPDRIHPEDQQLVFDALRPPHAGPKVIAFRVLRASGTYHWVECHLAPADGSPFRLIGIIRDIQKEREVAQLKSEFVSVVSHELRTPLTSIRGSLELIAGGVMGPIAPELAPMLDVAVRNSVRLQNLVDDLLDLQSLEAGQLTLQLQRLDLRDVVTSAVESAQAFADEHRITIEAPRAGHAMWVRGDQDRLAQVATNFLSNAIKFSPAGERVEIHLSSRDGHPRLSVADAGPGISDDFRPRIFERFAQSDLGSTRGVKGTGLGLAISRSIIERHSGRIGFDTEVGVGSTFWFELSPPG